MHAMKMKLCIFTITVIVIVIPIAVFFINFNHEDTFEEEDGNITNNQNISTRTAGAIELSMAKQIKFAPSSNASATTEKTHVINFEYEETFEEEYENIAKNQNFSAKATIAIELSMAKHIKTAPSSNDTYVTIEKAQVNKWDREKAQVKKRNSLAYICANTTVKDKPEGFWNDANHIGFPFGLIGNINASTTINYHADHEASTNTTDVVVFVKFHKVAGTSMACNILKYLQQSRTDDNFYLCASHYCSLPVARSFPNIVTKPSFNHTNHTIHIQDRNALLAGTANWVGPGAQQFIVFPILPSSQLQSSFNVKFMTILRDPVERIKSKYYYQRGSSDNPGWCVKNSSNCLAGKLTFLEWLKYYEHRKTTSAEMEVCCEYTKVLGGRSVDVAIRAIKLFDTILFTEQYTESTRTAAEALGILNYNEVPSVSALRNNTAVKMPWGAEERALAERITAGDTRIYNAALSLMRTRAQYDEDTPY